VKRKFDLLAFIHVAKTGGKTIETMLGSSFGFRYAPAVEWNARPVDNPNDVEYVVPKYNENDFRRLLKHCPFLKCVGGHSIALWSGIDRVRPTRYFSMIREPLTRGASHYQYHYTHDSPRLDWEHWVNWEVHHNHQVKMFSRNCETNEAIAEIQKHEVFVGLQDKFDESLVILKKMVAPELNISYSRTNSAKSNNIAKSLLANRDTREQLVQMYSKEFPLYEWIAKEYYPRFVKEYGPTLAADVEAFQKRKGQVNRLNMKLSRAYSRLFILPWAHGG